MLRFWFWVQMQLSALRDKPAREGGSTPVQSTPTHIVHIPSSEPDAPLKAVRVNRAMMRHLRRLVSLRGASYFDGPSVADECKRLGLTLRQYQDYLIRRMGYSRVRMHGLGWAMVLQSIFCEALQGDAASLRRTGICAVRLSPD